jgi:outer membrane receptor protein involved in Fe transport
VNVAEAAARGIDVDVQLRATETLDVRAGWALLDVRDGRTGERVETTPLHRLTVAASWRHAGVGLSATLRGAVAVDRFVRETDAGGDARARALPPLAQVDVRLAERIGRHVELFAGVDNVADAGDRAAVLRPRMFYGGVSAEL